MSRVAADVRLALRLLRRDWVAGELRLLVTALLIAVASTTLIQSFADRLERAMTHRAADILGGDIVIASGRPLPEAWRDEAQSRGLLTSVTTEFATVVLHGDAMQLASVKAVDGGWPLRGEIRTAERPFVEGQRVHRGPAPGTVWIEARLLGALDVELGESLEVGEARLRVAAIITRESDRGASFYSFSPRVMMSAADVDRAAVVQPGSRVTWRLAVAGEEAAVSRWRAWVEPLIEVHHQLQDPTRQRPEFSSALSRADRYLSLSGMMAVLLAGVAIALATRRYTERHFDMSALLRAMGASQSRILFLYTLQFFVIAAVGGALGILIGLLAQEGLVRMIEAIFPVELAAMRWSPAGIALATGALTLLGFGLPPLLRLKASPPIRVLRRDVLPQRASAWLVYGTAIGAMALLVGSLTGDPALTAMVMAGTLAAFGLFYGLTLGGLSWVSRLRVNDAALQLTLRRVTRNPGHTAGQVTGFGLVLMVMGLLVMLRTDLLEAWHAQVPEDAPNHFAINLVKDDVSAFEAFLDARSIPRAAMYPIVRGRLMTINGESVRANVSKEERTPGAVERELNLTWAEQYEADNHLIEGQWWNALPERPKEAPAPVSVEAKLASRLGIGLGDTLGFSVGGIEVLGEVTSIRTVRWDSFKPNFYMMFAPGSLEHLPATWMTSFHLSPEQKPLLNELVQRFRSVTVLEVDAMLRQVKSVLTQVTLAVEYILSFALAAGLAVLWAGVQTSVAERRHESALLRALGAPSKALRRARRSEFMLLGALSGGLAVLAAESVLALLHVRVFDLPFEWNMTMTLMLPLVGMFMVGVAGVAGTRGVLETPPVAVLREQE